ncbi:MAG: diaminopimelate epimerase [Lachnospiraceae bacterium]|jgi:diaminopimelate epimerase|nr:diaminopimelate epimerase [Lachnospiraceae bacterium]
MRFTKMHGCGNDFIFINCFEETVAEADESRLAQVLSDRNFGVGGDGVVFVSPSKEADVLMKMYNADGSYSAMCGNAIRCVAKFAHDNRLTESVNQVNNPLATSANQVDTPAHISVNEVSVLPATPTNHPNTLPITIKVASGNHIYDVELTPQSENDPQAFSSSLARVNMGKPETTAKLIPVTSDHEQVIDEELDIGGTIYRMTCVSMGNPHAVVFGQDWDKLQINSIGSLFENHERFPERTNVEFVEVIDRQTVQMRVWERGNGETLSCGSGSCAVLVACVLGGLTDREITVRQPGGELLISWDDETDNVYMQGEAVTVFTGAMNTSKS